MPEYLFDVSLTAAIRITADDEEAARKLLDVAEVLEAQLVVGGQPRGGDLCLTGTTWTTGVYDLMEVDGEAVGMPESRAGGTWTILELPPGTTHIMTGKGGGGSHIEVTSRHLPASSRIDVRSGGVGAAPRPPGAGLAPPPKPEVLVVPPPETNTTAENWVNRAIPGWPLKAPHGWGIYTAVGATVDYSYCCTAWVKASPMPEAFRPVWWDPAAEAYNDQGVGIHMRGWEFYREVDPEKGLAQVRVLSD